MNLSLPHLSMRWLPIWQRNLRVWRKLIGPSLLGNFGEPLLYLFAMGYGLGAFVGKVQGVPYIEFLAAGLVCGSTMNTATFEALYSAYTRMSPQRTWESMLATPLEVDDVVLGELIWAATKGLISVAAILIVAALMGLVHGLLSLLVLPVVFLVGLCFAAMALIMTAFAKGYDFFVYYFTLAVTPMFLLSGVFFPLEAMPAAIQTGAQLLPLQHAVEIVRPLMHGVWPGQLGLHLAVLIGYGAVSGYVAMVLLRRKLVA